MPRALALTHRYRAGGDEAIEHTPARVAGGRRRAVGTALLGRLRGNATSSAASPRVNRRGSLPK